MPEVMEDAVAAAKRRLDEVKSLMPIGVYANAFDKGAADDDANEAISDIRADLSPQRYLDWTDRWVAAGATLIGGCCGIVSDHIAALHAHYLTEGHDGTAA